MIKDQSQSRQPQRKLGLKLNNRHYATSESDSRVREPTRSSKKVYASGLVQLAYKRVEQAICSFPRESRVGLSRFYNSFLQPAMQNRKSST